MSGLSDMRLDRRRRAGVLLQTLLCWALIGVCWAGHRPYRRGERTRHTRHDARGSQRIEYPSVNDQGTQEVHYPAVHDRGQRIQYPSLDDSNAGLQIEKCAPGFYREGGGLYLGRCVPCECNGLADECEERTGKCINCRYNTAGDRCERCKDGYYGDAALRTCRLCPCPFSLPTNSFAVGCRQVFGDFECVCRSGYTGEKCERCAPGYYGDPLTPGGSCQRCNCNGNANCDPTTGVCKNSGGQGDTDTDEHCQECDSCAQTLLYDLEKLDDEFERVRGQLDNATLSASSRDQLKKLEKAISDTKTIVNTFNSDINNRRSKVKQLEVDTSALTDNVTALKEKADKRATDADNAVADIGKTHKRAKDLDTEINNMLKKIQTLLDLLKDEGTGGEDYAKLLQEAERMVKEMQEKNFTPQETAAEKERDEAQKLLDFIKANVTKLSDQNEAAAKNLRGHLTEYEAKLKELDKALKEATDLVKKANAENGLSAKAMEELKKRIENLKEEKETVEDQMAMAEDELQQAEDLLKMLTDSKAEYEQLAAQLSGAKPDLTKKVSELTKASGKEGVVKTAEDHAKKLDRMAKELEDSVKNASGRSDVRNAKDAIEAYKNITDAIKAAEEAANQAKDAADNALNNVKNQKLTQRAKDLKRTGDELVQEAQEAQDNLRDATDDLSELKTRLTNANKKKKTLEKDLLDAENQLNNNQRDDIANMINEAKRKAGSANDTAAKTMDRLNDIKKEIDKISTTPIDSNLGNILDTVDQSVKNLLNTIPSLDSKISEVENLTSNLSSITTISDNIKKIKDLIEQARDAANRIAIPMKFTGTTHVELHPPKNLDDLKAYTALSLALQRPESRGDGRRRRRQTREKADMFVLYLGSRDPSKNYIGMALRNNVLYGVYKLNGVEHEMKSGFITESKSEQSKFDKVELQRIYQDVEMILTKDMSASTPGEPIPSHRQGQDSKNLLDLSPSEVVFYVGGHPSNFTPPASLRYPGYKGCIELFSLNEKVVSLYNFKRAENIANSTCKRYVPPLVADYFEGTGYGKVIIDKLSKILQIQMSILTRSQNGLLFYIENEDNYIMVTMEKGFIVIHSDLLTAPVKGSKKSFPNGNWENVQIIIGIKDILVIIASQRIAQATVEINKDNFKEFYIGGAPQDVRDRHNITMQPFKGCVNNLKLKDHKSLDEQVGVSKGCPSDTLRSRKAEFSLGSSLSADFTSNLAEDVTVSLGFKSTENNGLILQEKQQANGINLEIENGYVVLTFNDKMWKSNKQYQDGKWHYLTVTKRGGRIELVIDDEDKGEVQSGSKSVPNTDGKMILGKGQFSGCITNLYTRRPENLYKAEDLTSFPATGDVLIDVCTSSSPAQLMMERFSKKDGVTQAINEKRESPCALPALVQHAYRMGGPVSSLSYSLPLQVLLPRPHFSLDVRTRSPEGLLFFAATRGGRSHLALYMSKGRIRLSAGKEKEIFNREKYNDGKWHSVIFSLEKKKFRLVVDGIRAQDGQLTSNELTSMQQFTSPVYLGSVPEALHKQLKSKGLPKQSVSGCIRNFKMNGALMSNPASNLGAGPCFEGQTQRGAYFSGNGAHAIINDSFVVGSSFEMLFNIRPRTLTGLLLHVGDSSRTQNGPTTNRYFSIYMLEGEVVAQVDNGNGKFMVSVKPKASLCDGMFHKISVIKRKNVVQLHVDTVDNYKIGPPLSNIALTKRPLYVGGIPEMQPTLPVTSSFVGCIQDMRIDDEPVSFERLSNVFGPVNLRECPG